MLCLAHCHIYNYPTGTYKRSAHPRKSCAANNCLVPGLGRRPVVPGIFYSVRWSASFFLFAKWSLVCKVVRNTGLDPRPLSMTILRPHYPLPTLEDVTSKLTGAKFFSVLDARS